MFSIITYVKRHVSFAFILPFFVFSIITCLKRYVSFAFILHFFVFSIITCLKRYASFAFILPFFVFSIITCLKRYVSFAFFLPFCCPLIAKFQIVNKNNFKRICLSKSLPQRNQYPKDVLNKSQKFY